jgi:hypothetical protein
MPYRLFKERPTIHFIDDVLQQLKQHAQPEIIDDLCRDPISKDVGFFILKLVELDGRKRPLGDLAPCPMCTPNRFLSGAFIYIPSMECCAVIGHCCADKEERAKAEREFRYRTRLEYEESYLLRALPLASARMAALISLNGSATEALRIYRRFRKRAPRIHEQLRRLRHQNAGHIKLSEIIRSNEDESKADYTGPAGFRGRGSSNIETRDHDFGLLAGGIAVNAEYNPEKELHTIVRQLESILSSVQGLSEESILYFIAELTDAKRRAAVALMEIVDRGIERFIARIREFEQFFTADNAVLLKAFGDSQHNSQGFAVEFRERNGQAILEFEQSRKKCELRYSPSFAIRDFTWPK